MRFDSAPFQSKKYQPKAKSKERPKIVSPVKRKDESTEK